MSEHLLFLMFRSSHFWFLVTFGDEVTKIRKYYIIFVYILQGKMGKTEKKRKENHTTKVTKNQKAKIWDERNIRHIIFNANSKNIVLLF